MHRTGYAIIPYSEELFVIVYNCRFSRIVVYSPKLVIYDISMARVLDFELSSSVVQSIETVMTLQVGTKVLCQSMFPSISENT